MATVISDREIESVAANPREVGDAISVLAMKLKLLSQSSWFAMLVRGAMDIWNWMPLTWTGLLCLVSINLAERFLVGEHPDLIACTVIVVIQALLIICLISVLLSSLWFRFRRQPLPIENGLELVVGYPVSTQYRLGRISFFPFVQYAITWRDQPQMEVDVVPTASGLCETVTARERGRIERVVRELSVSDVFGFFRIRFARSMPLQLRCLPRPGSLTKYPLIEQFRPGDTLGHPEGQPVGDMVEMRRYAMGDPLKLVLWKVYARTGRMLVRTPERSVSPTDRMLAYFVSSSGDEPSAGLARTAIETGSLGKEVIFMAEGAHEPAKSPVECVEQIVDSVNHRRDGGANLDRFLSLGESLGTSAAFVFVSDRPGPWVDRVLKAMREHRGPFYVVMGLSGVATHTRNSTWTSRFMQQVQEGATPNQIESLRSSFEKVGAIVTIIENEGVNDA